MGNVSYGLYHRHRTHWVCRDAIRCSEGRGPELLIMLSYSLFDALCYNASTHPTNCFCQYLVCLSILFERITYFNPPPPIHNTLAIDDASCPLIPPLNRNTKIPGPNRLHSREHYWAFSSYPHRKLSSTFSYDFEASSQPMAERLGCPSRNIESSKFDEDFDYV
jgi:hypothetical protein